MKLRARVVRISSFLAIALVLVLALAVAKIESVIDWAMTPRTSFDVNAVPVPPRYEDDSSWSALPGRDDAADQYPVGAAPIDQRTAPVDAFYVHPTSYVGSEWNASTSDARLNADTDRVATGIQASAFNACCAVYAPRYRQANGTAFYRPSEDGQHAIDVAYSDVRRAFMAFQARRGSQRPFVLAAHSQGAILATRLLADVIHGTELRDQLVAAYLIGGEVTVEGLRERTPDIEPCRSHDDLHCVVAYQARGPAFVPTRFDLNGSDRRERLCTNPLSWRTDGQHIPADQNLGAVFLETEDRSPRLGFADAKCVDGNLVVAKIGAVPRDLASRVLDRVMGAGNYHPIEYQLYFMNLRTNATARSTAWVKSTGSATQAE